MSTKRIAEHLNIPFAFLTKVLKGLVRGEILVSQRGPTGGVALARPASQITLLDIVRSAGEDDIFQSCVLGLPACNDHEPCALHAQWSDHRRKLETLFVKTTMADLL